MKQSTLILFLYGLSLCPSRLFSQNIFPVKLTTCETAQFCLDCGQPKAGYDTAEFAKLVAGLNNSHSLRNLHGAIKMQLLIDTMGQGCVLSHTDVSNNSLTRDIIDKLNKFGFWKSAIEDGHPKKSSVNISFEINNGQLLGKLERIDQEAFLASFDRPRDPEIYNKEFVYKNSSLPGYDITVWNKGSSDLPDNASDQIAVDKDDKVWLATDKGLICSDGGQIQIQDSTRTPFTGKERFWTLATDNSNNKWVMGWVRRQKGLYKLHDQHWEKMDSVETGTPGIGSIINNPVSGELFFCTDKGLVIYKDGKWTLWNREKIPELPDEKVVFGKRDRQGRLWIGTYKGSIRVDPDGKVTEFNKTQTALANTCLSSLVEDEEGTVYLSTYEYSAAKGTINRKEGLITLSRNNEWTQYLSSNSGMPFNHVTGLLYDPFEKIVWIATDRAGLVRYDRKGNWENYHNKNSSLPTSYISGLAQDSKGTLYLSTRYGLVRIRKKKA